METTQADKKRKDLANELRGIADDAQGLVENAGEHVAQKTEELKARLTDALELAKNMGKKIQEQAVVGAKATDKVIRANPYEAVGVALGVGVLIGYLIKRK